MCTICLPTHRQSIEELEKEMLNGQKLQGPATSVEVYHILKQKGLVDKSVQTSFSPHLYLKPTHMWLSLYLCLLLFAVLKGATSSLLNQ